MDPLITSRLDPALLRVLDKRNSDPEQGSRRRRPAGPEKPVEPEDEAAGSELHIVDDLA
jgi:hypothetical protein